MSHRASLTFRNTRSAVADIQKIFESLAEKCNLHQSDQFDLALVLEELITNIVFYSGENGSVEATISLVSDEKRCEITLTDNGIPFDPTAYPAPATDVDLEERTTGGLGIHIVRSLVDSITYRREAGRNILHLEKSLHSKQF